jgi:hypothetical protein
MVELKLAQPIDVTSYTISADSPHEEWFKIFDGKDVLLERGTLAGKLDEIENWLTKAEAYLEVKKERVGGLGAPISTINTQRRELRGLVAALKQDGVGKDGC